MAVKHAQHLLDEQPIMVYPSLALELGINKAIVFQKLHFLLNGQKEAKNEYNFVDARWWVYNSYAEWRSDFFPWLSVSTLKGIFNELEDDGVVLSRQSVKNKSDRRKWYSIDYQAWDKKCLIMGQKMSDQPSAKNYLMMGQKIADGYSNSSSNTKEKEKDISAGKPAIASSIKEKKTPETKPGRKTKKTPPPTPPQSGKS